MPPILMVHSLKELEMMMMMMKVLGVVTIRMIRNKAVDNRILFTQNYKLFRHLKTM